MTGVEITKLDLIGEKPEGATYTFDAQDLTKGLLGFRKANSVSGRHYHRGESPTKNPETFILISGDIVLNTINIDTEEQDSCEISGPVKVNFHPFIWHEVIAKTDISFLELNSIEEHASDTYYDYQPV